jgi:hypothetical protein
MSEYVLRITSEAHIEAKRLSAPNDSLAIRAALQWEDHNADMILSSEGRVVAEKRDRIWSLEPEARFEREMVSNRAAINDFTVGVGWAGRAGA